MKASFGKTHDPHALVPSHSTELVLCRADVFAVFSHSEVMKCHLAGMFMTDYSHSYQQFLVGFTDKFNVISGFYSSWPIGNQTVSKAWLSFCVTLNSFIDPFYTAMWAPPSGCYVDAHEHELLMQSLFGKLLNRDDDHNT